MSSTILFSRCGLFRASLRDTSGLGIIIRTAEGVRSLFSIDGEVRTISNVNATPGATIFVGGLSPQSSPVSNVVPFVANASYYFDCGPLQLGPLTITGPVRPSGGLVTVFVSRCARQTFSTGVRISFFRANNTLISTIPITIQPTFTFLALVASSFQFNTLRGNTAIRRLVGNSVYSFDCSISLRPTLTPFFTLTPQPDIIKVVISCNKKCSKKCCKKCSKK